MRISFVSVDGLDDSIKISDLVSISQKYPFVEWNVKLTAGNIKHKDGWIDQLLNESSCNTCLRSSIELSEKLSIDYIYNKYYTRYLNFFKNKILNLDLDLESQESIIGQLKKYYGIGNFIFRTKKIYNYLLLECKHANVSVNSLFMNEKFFPHTNFVSIKNLHPGYYCPHISPSTIDKVYNKLYSDLFNHDVWLQLHSGVQTKGRLDLNKLIDCLKYIKNKNVNL